REDAGQLPVLGHQEGPDLARHHPPGGFREGGRTLDPFHVSADQGRELHGSPFPRSRSNLPARAGLKQGPRSLRSRGLGTFGTGSVGGRGGCWIRKEVAYDATWNGPSTGRGDFETGAGSQAPPESSGQNDRRCVRRPRQLLRGRPGVVPSGVRGTDG